QVEPDAEAVRGAIGELWATTYLRTGFLGARGIRGAGGGRAPAGGGGPRDVDRAVGGSGAHPHGVSLAGGVEGLRAPVAPGAFLRGAWGEGVAGGGPASLGASGGVPRRARPRALAMARGRGAATPRAGRGPRRASPALPDGAPGGGTAGAGAPLERAGGAARRPGAGAPGRA